MLAADTGLSEDLEVIDGLKGLVMSIEANSRLVSKLITEANGL
jgi:hypothetical protein